jgi:Family of unknown function (DUF6714)
MTPGRDAVAAAIEEAFGANDYPGDEWILGSSEGCEPLDEVGTFHGRADWRAIEPEFLDTHYVALSFFSEAGFRYFLPAYMLADLADHLQTADPVFHLVHGFSDVSVNQEIAGRAFEVRTGSRQFINPRRYGAATFLDYARYRLSVFTREEAVAIVLYLECVRDRGTRETWRGAIDAALESFWRERARSAPKAAGLKRHQDEQTAYLDALARRREQGP